MRRASAVIILACLVAVELLRGWARAGLFHAGGTCPNDASSCDRNGQEISAGLDLMAPTGTPLTPYLGAGAAYRVGAQLTAGIRFSLPGV